VIDEFKMYSNPDLPLTLKLREVLSQRYVFKNTPEEVHSDVNKVEARIINEKKFAKDYKPDKKKIKQTIVSELIKLIENNLWLKFELYQKLNNKDLAKVVEQYDSDLIWQDCHKFLAVDN
jgi:hypothetical protein